MASEGSTPDPVLPDPTSPEVEPIPGESHVVRGLHRHEVRQNYWAIVISEAAAAGFLTLRSGYLGAVFEPVSSTVFAITFAATAHRWLSPLVAPLIGRLSDRSARLGGRRKPFMAAGLIVIGVASVLLGVGPRSYWPMVLIVAIASVGWTSYRIPRFSATPDLFGQSIWAGMEVSLAIAGLLPNLFIQVVINRTWERSHSTAFVFAGVVALIGGIYVLLRVKEPRVEQEIAAARASGMTIQERLHYVASHRNLLVLLVAVGIISTAASPVAPLYVLYAGKVLGVGARTVAAAGIYGSLVALPLVPLVGIVAARLDRKVVGVGCLAIATFLAIKAHNASDIVTITAYGVVAALIGVAIAVSLGTLLLVLFPREVLAEIAGLWTAITTIGSIAVSYGVSIGIQVTGNWRLVWLPLIFGCPAALVCLLFLDLPQRYRRPDISKLRSSMRTALQAGIRGFGPAAPDHSGHSPEERA